MRVNYRLATFVTGLVFASVAGLAAQHPVQGTPDQMPGGGIAPLAQEVMAIRLFQERVTDYVTLHRLLEGGLPPLRPTTDMEEIRITMQALATRIQFARHTAQQGAIFTPEVAPMIRARIARALPPEEWDAILKEQAVDEDGRPVRIPVLRVNMEWPGAVPINFMPTRALSALPQLPPELQYRLIGRTLVLWDHHADLIIDFLPGAIVT